MSQRVTQNKGNFTAGEIKPSLHAREDLNFFNNGAKAIENMIVLPEGGVTRRPGTRFVLELKNEAEKGLLVPFKFSRTDARVLCLNGGVGRVFKDGGFVETSPGSGVPYEFAQPWTAAALPNLRWAEAADVMFVADGGAPQTITRNADTNWTVDDYAAVNGPVRSQNVDTAKTIGVSGVSGTITLTANFDIFEAGHVGSLWRLDESDLSLIPYWTASETVTTGGLPAVSFRRYLGNVYEALPPPGGSNGPHPVGVNPPIHLFGEAQSTPNAVQWRFKYAGFGYVRITAVADARTATATVLGVARTAQTVLPDSILSKATYRWSEAAWSGVRGYPSVVAFGQQRVVWLDGKGQYWATRTGDYYDFAQTSDAASAFSDQLLSMDGSVIQPYWAIANGWWLVGAADNEPVIRGPGAFDAITRNNVTNVTDSGQGSAPHVPAFADAGVAFIGASRQRLHYGKINRLIDGVKVEELSIASNHILAGKASALAYQHDPHRLLWGCSQNGDLWCYTFRPDQQVVAAHRHPMPGAQVESLAAVWGADGAHVDLWLIVRRVVGATPRRFVEVLTLFPDLEDYQGATAAGAWFYDCALSYSGPPVTTLGGLAHLAGAQVGVFLNGQDLPRRTVSGGGTISLPPVSVAQIDVVVGLPIPFKLQTLDMTPFAESRSLKNGRKRATHGAVDLLKSWGLDVSSDAGEGALEEERLFALSDAPLLGAPMPLFTGRKTFPIEGAHGDAVSIIASGDHGYPVTIRALAPDLEIMET